MAPLSHTLALLAVAVVTTAIQVNLLDMALDSFDDQYLGCGSTMTAALPALNRTEFWQNPLFARVWAKAEVKWRERGSRVSPLVSPAQAIALMAYTMKDLYKEFNAAVRTAGRSSQEYRDRFHFKTLHFLLTQALGRLRDTRGPQCYNVSRGVRDVQFEARRGHKVRFGQFTSTSQSEGIAQQYGTDTMFQVLTCHGVDIQDFSYYRSNHEVLIPPYETFVVTRVTQEGDTARIQLHPNGTFSKYNCEWLQGGSVPRAPFQLGGLLLATTAMAVTTGML